MRMLIIFAALIVALYFLWDDVSNPPQHLPISIGDVTSVYLIKEQDEEGREATPEETGRTVELFNSVTDIEEGNKFTGTNYDGAIKIDLENDKYIHIQVYENRVSVQRNDVSSEDYIAYDFLDDADEYLKLIE